MVLFCFRRPAPAGPACLLALLLVLISFPSGRAAAAAANGSPPASPQSPPSAPAPAPDDPVLATLEGRRITLRLLEEFARELPSAQRVPVAADAAKWRQVICRELAKNFVFTKKALAESRHTDPRYLRGREYFVREYFSYALLRDEVLNRIDVSRATLEALYERRKQDYYSSPTVRLRLIRLRTEDEAVSAAARLAAGEAFEAVERDMSRVSPRYKNRVLGPYPSAGDRTAIPPPAQVIDAALDLEPGRTTGPLQANGFWFLVRTESKEPGRQRSFDEVVEEVEKRLRQGMGEHLTRELMKRLKEELRVEHNDAALDDPRTRPEDVIATVGAVRVPLREFTDLRGRVRGPAVTAADLEASPLARFLTPLILAEAACARGYMERDEFKRASYYYDLQQLGGRMAESLAGLELPEPTEGEMRARYRQEAMHAHRHRGPRPGYEEMKEDIRHAIRQQARPAVEERVVREALEAAGFGMVRDPLCARLTAIEALAVAAGKAPAGARLIEMVGLRGDAPDAVPPPRTEIPVPALPLCLSGVGRHPAWRISYATPEGQADLVVEEAGRLNDGSAAFTSNTLTAPWSELLRFDTDGLARVAMDDGLADFAAKYGDRTRVTTSVQFGYDESGEPADCVIRFAAVPGDLSVDDGIELRYDARTGEQTRRRVGEAPPPCPTCPGPDKPVL